MFNYDYDDFVTSQEYDNTLIHVLLSIHVIRVCITIVDDTTYRYRSKYNMTITYLLQIFNIHVRRCLQNHDSQLEQLSR